MAIAMIKAFLFAACAAQILLMMTGLPSVF